MPCHALRHPAPRSGSLLGLIFSVCGTSARNETLSMVESEAYCGGGTRTSGSIRRAATLHRAVQKEYLRSNHWKDEVPCAFLSGIVHGVRGVYRKSKYLKLWASNVHLRYSSNLFFVSKASANKVMHFTKQYSSLIEGLVAVDIRANANDLRCHEHWHWCMMFRTAITISLFRLCENGGAQRSAAVVELFRPCQSHL